MMLSRLAPPIVALVVGMGSPGVAGLPSTPVGSPQDGLPEILKRSIALYPTLKSYADTGTVISEHTGLKEHARFKTSFRAPTDFFFEFSDHTSVSAGQTITMPTHLVVWMLNGELEHWNAVLKTHETVPRASGGQVDALVTAGTGTYGTASLVASLIFVQSRIVGPVQELVQASAAGEEPVGERRCQKIVGVARSVYPSGAVTNVRPMTVWIDAESLLIRKIFEDTPEGYLPGGISRRTVTFEPRANVALTDANFQYTVTTQE